MFAAIDVTKVNLVTLFDTISALFLSTKVVLSLYAKPAEIHPIHVVLSLHHLPADVAIVDQKKTLEYTSHEPNKNTGRQAQ